MNAAQFPSACGFGHENHFAQGSAVVFDWQGALNRFIEIAISVNSNEAGTQVRSFVDASTDTLPDRNTSAKSDSQPAQYSALLYPMAQVSESFLFRTRINNDDIGIGRPSSVLSSSIAVSRVMRNGISRCHVTTRTPCIRLQIRYRIAFKPEFGMHRPENVSITTKNVSITT